MSIVVTDTDVLKEMISESVMKAFSIASNPVLTFKEAHEFLKMSPNKLRSMAMDKKIPFIREGKNMKFRMSDINDYLNKCRVA